MNTQAPIGPDGRPVVDIATVRPTVNVDQINAAAQAAVVTSTQNRINPAPGGALASISAMLGRRQNAWAPIRTPTLILTSDLLAARRKAAANGF